MEKYWNRLMVIPNWPIKLFSVFKNAKDVDNLIPIALRDLGAYRPIPRIRAAGHAYQWEPT